MGFFDFMKSNETEERNVGTGTSITSLFNPEQSIGEDVVLKIPTVQSCYELIAGTIAQLPIYLYRETEDGSVDKISDDYRNILLNDEPNEFQSAYSMKKQMVKDYLFRGATYSYVERNGNEILEIITLNASDIIVDKYIKDGFRVVDADIKVMSKQEGRQGNGKNDKKPLQILKPYDCIIALKDSSDGLTSKGILDYGKDVFQVALEEKKYTSGIYKNGALPLGVLKTTGRLTQGAVDKLKASWQSLYSGSSNAGKTVILEEGLDYSPVSLKPGDLLLTDNRKDVISDICKLFNLPESLIDVTKIKYGSLEQNNIHFLQYTLSPILTALENGLNRALLLEEEKKNGYFFAFDTSEVLRSTDREKYDAVKVALDGGIMSINEARYKLNLPKIKDDVMKWSLGAVLYYPETGEMKIPNMGIGIEGAENKDVIKEEEEEIKDEINSKDV